MTEIEEQKVQEEIHSIQQERKLSQFRVYTEMLKLLLGVIGAVVLFLFIQNPDIFIKERQSKEEIRRERAKLILDWLKEENPEKRLEAIEIIKAVYGESEDGWLNKISSLQEKLDRSEASKEMYDEYLQNKEKLLNLQGKAEAEANNPLRPGKGYRYQSIIIEQKAVEARVEILKEKLNRYGWNIE